MSLSGHIFRRLYSKMGFDVLHKNGMFYIQLEKGNLFFLELLFFGLL